MTFVCNMIPICIIRMYGILRVQVRHAGLSPCVPNVDDDYTVRLSLFGRMRGHVTRLVRKPIIFPMSQLTSTLAIAAAGSASGRTTNTITKSYCVITEHAVYDEFSPAQCRPESVGISHMLFSPSRLQLPGWAPPINVLELLEITAVFRCRRFSHLQQESRMPNNKTHYRHWASLSRQQPTSHSMPMWLVSP
jgi:hypothetical protein